MKRNTLLFLLSLSTLFLFTSCDKEQLDFRNSLIGSYSSIEACENLDFNGTLEIFKEGWTNDEIRLEGSFYGFNVDLVAVLNGTRLVVPTQSFTIQSSGNSRIYYNFSGDGTVFDDESIQLDYDVTRYEEIGPFLEIDDEGSCTLILERL